MNDSKSQKKSNNSHDEFVDKLRNICNKDNMILQERYAFICLLDQRFHIKNDDYRSEQYTLYENILESLYNINFNLSELYIDEFLKENFALNPN